jgi:hypothetical protein
MEGFGFSTTLSASFRFWTGGGTTVEATLGLAL